MAASLLRRSAYLLTGVALYALFLVVTLPASWMGELLTRASHGSATLQDAAGTVWGGSGTLRWSLAGRDTLAVPLRWSIEPWWLLAGRVQAEIETRGELTLHGQIAVGYRRLDIRALEAEFPAALLATLYTPATVIAPTGVARLAVTDLELTRDAVHGEARLTWTGAGSRFGGLNDVGDYLLIATGQGDSTQLRAETPRGEVQINGQGSWRVADGSLQFSGTLTPGTRDATLAPLLQGLGVRRDGDRYVVEINTRAPFPLLTGAGRP